MSSRIKRKHNPGFSVIDPSEPDAQFLFTLRGKADYQEDLAEGMAQIGAASVQPDIQLD